MLHRALRSQHFEGSPEVVLSAEDGKRMEIWLRLHGDKLIDAEPITTRDERSYWRTLNVVGVTPKWPVLMRMTKHGPVPDIPDQVYEGPWLHELPEHA